MKKLTKDTAPYKSRYMVFKDDSGDRGVVLLKTYEEQVKGEKRTIVKGSYVNSKELAIMADLANQALDAKESSLNNLLESCWQLDAVIPRGVPTD